MFLREEEDLYANLLPTGRLQPPNFFPLRSLINNCTFLMGESAVPARHCIQDLYVPKKSAEAEGGRTQLWKLPTAPVQTQVLNISQIQQNKSKFPQKQCCRKHLLATMRKFTSSGHAVIKMIIPMCLYETSFAKPHVPCCSHGKW